MHSKMIIYFYDFVQIPSFWMIQTIQCYGSVTFFFLFGISNRLLLLHLVQMNMVRSFAHNTRLSCATKVIQVILSWTCGNEAMWTLNNVIFLCLGILLWITRLKIMGSLYSLELKTNIKLRLSVRLLSLSYNILQKNSKKSQESLVSLC